MINSLTWLQILVFIVVFTQHKISFSFTHNAALLGKIKILTYSDRHVRLNGSWKQHLETSLSYNLVDIVIITQIKIYNNLI